MNEELVQNIVMDQNVSMGEKFVKNFVMGAKIDPKVDMDLSKCELGGWKILQKKKMNEELVQNIVMDQNVSMGEKFVKNFVMGAKIDLKVDMDPSKCELGGWKILQKKKMNEELVQNIVMDQNVSMGEKFVKNFVMGAKIDLKVDMDPSKCELGGWKILQKKKMNEELVQNIVMDQNVSMGEKFVKNFVMGAKIDLKVDMDPSKCELGGWKILQKKKMNEELVQNIVMDQNVSMGEKFVKNFVMGAKIDLKVDMDPSKCELGGWKILQKKKDE